MNITPVFLDSSGTGGGGTLAPSLLFIVALVAGIVFYVQNRQPFQADAYAALPADIALQTVVQAFTMRGWTVTVQGVGFAAFAKHKNANWLIAIILLLFFIVPGIVYLVLAGRTLTASVNTNMAGPETSSVRLVTNMRGFGGKAAVLQALQALPRVPGAGAAGSSPYNPPPAI